jgi:heme A synthase
VSAYYYTGAVPSFVGVIFALSLFLFTYPGYENVVADRVVGTLGGFAALGVVLFPTAAPTEQLRLQWWKSWMGTFHYITAVSLFVSFILFSLWLFPKSDVPVHKQPREKRVRNLVYVSCGIVMIISMLWAGLAGFLNKSIFIPEAFAIEAFAVSWLVKGEAEHTLVLVAQRLFPGEHAGSKLVD